MDPERAAEQVGRKGGRSHPDDETQAGRRTGDKVGGGTVVRTRAPTWAGLIGCNVAVLLADPAVDRALSRWVTVCRLGG